MAKSVEGVYSGALFELAQEKNKLKELMEEGRSLLTVLLENPEFPALLSNPRITREEKLDVVKETFEGRLSPEMLGFLELLVEKDRTAFLERILDGFLREAEEKLGIGRVYVRSAAALTDAQKETLEGKLLRDTGFQTLEMSYTVDPGLIGGMVISIGDRVVDDSLKSKLMSLERDLLWKARMDYLRTA